jgi:hypothetical protein
VFKYEHEKKEVFMKAIILARVSTKEQEDGHSLNAQGQRLFDFF